MISSVISEIDLIRLITEGDEAAFNELYNRYWKLLYVMAVRKTGNKDDALDIVQDLFVEVWNRREHLAITFSLESYLKSSLFYKILKHFHTKGFHEKHLKDFQSFAMNTSGPQAYLDPAELMTIESQYEELIQVINRTIEEMPGRMQAIFTMSRMQEYSISEIAAQLNISQQTVKNQISAAFSRIRKATEDYPVNATSIAFVIWLMNR